MWHTVQYAVMVFPLETYEIYAEPFLSPRLLATKLSHITLVLGATPQQRGPEGRALLAGFWPRRIAEGKVLSFKTKVMASFFENLGTLGHSIKNGHLLRLPATYSTLGTHICSI